MTLLDIVFLTAAVPAVACLVRLLVQSIAELETEDRESTTT